MYSTVSYDTLISCPFEASHRIEAQKLVAHVVKCQKNEKYKHASLLTCPLNAEHKVHSSEIVHHLSMCDGRRTLEESMYLKDEEHEKKYSVKHPTDIPTEENWDHEFVPAYDPNEYLAKHKIIRMKKVEPPSVRKAFKVEQRLHIAQLNSELPVDMSPRPEKRAPPVDASAVLTPPSTSKAEEISCSDPYYSKKREQEFMWTKVKNSRGKRSNKF